MKLQQLIEKNTLSRLYQHFTGQGVVAIITAFRAEYTYEENTERNRELAATVRNAGFGFVYVDGGWIENKGTEREQEVSEVALMIHGDQHSGKKLFDLCVSLAKKYNQDGFIFKGPSDAKTALYDGNGELVDTFKGMTLDKLSEYFTRLRGGSHAGRSFTFESLNIIKDSGMIGRMIKQRRK